ncbi:MAG: hypothetical protein ABW352_19780, partial [Polyangiales bacterium]
MRSSILALSCLLLLACDEPSEAEPAPIERGVDASAPANDRVKAAPRDAGERLDAARVQGRVDASPPIDAGRDEGLTCYPLLAHAG